MNATTKLKMQIVCAAVIAACAASNKAGEPALIPQPQSIKMSSGTFAISGKTRIVALDPKLAPLTKVLASEIRLKTGLDLETVVGPAEQGDITLAMSVMKGTEAYHLDVSATAIRVTAGTYQGAAWGTVTLLQAIGGTTDAFVPCMTIEDEPKYQYRGFMKDVGRQDVPIEQLYASVNLCRLYKTRYLHLHLSDDHAFTFPSKRFPKLGNHNTGAHSGPAPKVYDLQQLKDLVKYADERGVTIIPEIDSPGHTGAMRLSMPDVFDSPAKPGGPARLGLVNMCSEKTYAAMDELIGEQCMVFASSPYIHIGADEVGADAIKSAPQYKAFIAEHQLKNPQEVFTYYTQRLSDMVAKRGKLAIAWEGVPLNKEDPKKMVIMAWTMSSGPTATEAVERGFQVINAPNHAFNGQQEISDHPITKDPLGYNFQRDIRGFNVDEKTRIDSANPLLIGGQMNDWESTWEYALPIARRSVASATANEWNTTKDRPIDPFLIKFAATDGLLDRLIAPINIKIDRADDFDPKDAVQRLRTNILFTKPITFTASSPFTNAAVRYTSDGTIPTADSPELTAAVTIDQTSTYWLGLFDAQGTKLAPAQRLPFEKINYEKSLATGKPVTASGHEGDEASEKYLTDGFAKFDIWRGWWGAGPTPQWAQVDLGASKPINRIELFPYWDGQRYYQYTISVSEDSKNWKQVVDQSANTKPSTADGTEFVFDTVMARYVRVDVTKNSANSSAHLVDLRVFGPDQPS